MLETRPDSAVLEAGGVGYQVYTTPGSLRGLAVGQEALLWTTLIVREDAQLLYGFGTREDRELFDLLRSVNGVGPRTALAVLSDLTVEEIAHAVSTEDDKPFRKVSGVGPKTAKLIAVSLAGRLPASALAAQAPEQPPAAADPGYADVVVALTGLGWTESLAESLVASLPEGLTHADALRRALTSRKA